MLPTLFLEAEGNFLHIFGPATNLSESALMNITPTAVLLLSLDFSLRFDFSSLYE